MMLMLLMVVMMRMLKMLRGNLVAGGHAMLCYVMFIFKIDFQNKIFKIECSKSKFQNRSHLQNHSFSKSMCVQIYL